MRNKTKLAGLGGAVFALAMSGLTPMASAEEITLSAVAAWPQGTSSTLPFEVWIDKINEEGEGLIQINFVGGAPAVGNQFNLVKRVQSGVFDMLYTTNGYYSSDVPAAEALSLTEYTIAEQRVNGGFEFLQELHAEKGLHYLGRTMDSVPFHLYLNTKIDSSDLSGLTIRASASTQPFFASLGATTMRAPVPEVYTLMERGVVDGFGWIAQHFFDFSWDQVVKYRVEPGFYTANGNILVSLDKWQEMSDEQRAFLEDMMLQFEALNYLDAEYIAAEKAAQTAAGIETITLSPEDAEIWVAAAKEAAWASVVAHDPENAEKLRELLTVN